MTRDVSPSSLSPSPSASSTLMVLERMRLPRDDLGEDTLESSSTIFERLEAKFRGLVPRQPSVSLS
jgi:hypothetical protein